MVIALSEYVLNYAVHTHVAMLRQCVLRLRMLRQCKLKRCKQYR